jgi:hypothetical protein
MSTRFNIPKIYKPLILADYAEEFGEARVNVWVNPPVSTLREYSAIMESEAETQTRLNQVIAWLAVIWQDVTIAEITGLIDTAFDTDPLLWKWLIDNTFRLIAAHRTNQKKD